MKNVRDYNVGNSDYAKHEIQPWDIILEYRLNYWDGDIIKRVLRKKEGEPRRLDYEKIIHICNERIRQIDAEDKTEAVEDVDVTTVFCMSESFKPEYSTYGNNVFSVRAVFKSSGHWYAYVGYNEKINAHLYLALTSKEFAFVQLEDFPLPVVPLSNRLEDIEHSASVKIGAPGLDYAKYDYIIGYGTLYRFMGLTEDKKLYKYGRFMGDRKIDSIVLPTKIRNHAMQVVCGK